MSADETVSKLFTEHGVVPDVIDKAPAALCHATYEHKLDMQTGRELTPRAVKHAPTVSWKADDNALYTLVLTDPDAPSRAQPTQREWLHWLVVNIPGHDVAKGQSLVDYVSSAPPKGSGLHRYVLLVYKQANKINPDEKHIPNTVAANRNKWAVRKFAAKYHLGNPVFGNFYQAQWDDYVPQVYEQLKG